MQNRVLTHSEIAPLGRRGLTGWPSARIVLIMLTGKHAAIGAAYRQARGEPSMPKGPRGEKRPADGIGAAIKVARIATHEIEEDIDPDGPG